MLISNWNKQFHKYVKCSIYLLLITHHRPAASGCSSLHTTDQQRLVAPHYTPKTSKYSLHHLHKNHYKTYCTTSYPLFGPPTETTWMGKPPLPRPRLMPAHWPTTVPAISSFPPWVDMLGRPADHEPTVGTHTHTEVVK